MADLFAWLISFFLLIALLVLVTYQLMCLADLEFDYINPYDSSARINKVVLPEFIIQGVLCCFYLVTRHWIMSLFCAPYLFFNIRLFRQRRHLVDITEIFNMLYWEKMHRLVKLFYLVFILFLSDDLYIIGSVIAVHCLYDGVLQTPRHVWREFKED